MNKWCHLNLLGDLTNVPNLSAWLSQAATECKELDLPNKKRHLFYPRNFGKGLTGNFCKNQTEMCISLLGQSKGSFIKLLFIIYIHGNVSQ